MGVKSLSVIAPANSTSPFNCENPMLDEWFTLGIPWCFRVQQALWFDYLRMLELRIQTMLTWSTSLQALAGRKPVWTKTFVFLAVAFHFLNADSWVKVDQNCAPCKVNSLFQLISRFESILVSFSPINLVVRWVLSLLHFALSIYYKQLFEWDGKILKLLCRCNDR